MCYPLSMAQRKGILKTVWAYALVLASQTSADPDYALHCGDTRETFRYVWNFEQVEARPEPLWREAEQM
jgi:hypothetical protein